MLNMFKNLKVTRELETKNKESKSDIKRLKKEIRDLRREGENDRFEYNNDVTRLKETNRVEMVGFENRVNEKAVVELREVRAMAYSDVIEAQEQNDTKLRETKVRFGARVDELKDDVLEAQSIAKEGEVLVKLYSDKTSAYKEQVSDYRRTLGNGHN